MIRARVKYGLGCMLMWIMSTFNLSAQTPVTTLPGTYGTEFWAGFLINNGTKMDDASLKLTIYAVAEEQVNVIIALGSAPERPLGTIAIPAGGGFGKFDGLDPKVAYIDVSLEEEKVAKKGLVIYAEDGKTKFTCYAFAEAEGGEGSGSSRDATILLPKELLWKEYFVQTYLDDAKSTEFMVVGTEKNTNVTIYPSATTSKGVSKGQAITIKLNPGEVYFVQSKAKKQDEVITESINMSGSMICSDKPIAVFSGNEFAKIPNDGAYSGNHSYEQLIPHNIWGNEFYVGLPGGVLRTVFQVTAAYDNTNVEVGRKNSTQTFTLNRGESLPAAVILLSPNLNATIKSDKPVLCYTYSTCGAVNQDLTQEQPLPWGNPTNAMIVPWSHRVKEMSFYTDSIPNQTEEAKQKYFVQVITSASDISKIVLDDSIPIAASSFTLIAKDATKAYANVELTTHGKHRLSTTGDGFVGYILGMTSQARAYQYTLGFNPPTPYDSLYIENPEPIMSKSYNVPYMDGKGWYQRQYRDWLPTEERIDTAIVCDSTILNFKGILPDLNKEDSVKWKVYKCDNTTFKKKELILDSVSTPRGIEHKLAYQFILDDQSGLAPTKRTPFQYYMVEMERYKNHIICTDLEPDLDTLQTMVRVNRMYNDTTWRIVCETDTIHFFYDDYNHSGDTTVSIFKYNKQDVLHDTILFKKGANTYTRRYISQGGCDSIVTLKIWGCDTALHVMDSTVCQLDVKNLNIVIDDVPRLQPSNFKIIPDAENPYDSVYSHVILVKDKCISDGAFIPWLTHGAYASFKGCKDSLAFKLRIMPLTYYPQEIPTITPWCTQGDETKVYDDWVRKDGSLIRIIKQDDPAFNSEGYGYFKDTTWWNPCPDCPNGKCPKEINLLILQKVSNVNQTDTVHICRNKTYTHTKFMAKDRKTYKGWELPIGEQPTEFHLVAILDGNDTLCQYWDTLRLFVHPVYQDTLAAMNDIDHVCVNKPYAWLSHTGGDNQHEVWDKVRGKRTLASQLPTDSVGEFIFIDSLKTTTCPDCKQGAGCDSIWTLHLSVNPTYLFPDSFGLCDNDTLRWQKKLYCGYNFKGRLPSGDIALINRDYYNKNFEDTRSFSSQYGCDSIHTLKIRLYKTYVTEVDTAICENQPYHFFDEVYHFTAREEPYDLFNMAQTVVCHCDSGVTHHVTVYPVYSYHHADTTCQLHHGKYSWENHPVTGEAKRQIWMVDSAAGTKVLVWTDSIPISTAGRYTLIDSLRSHACAACNSGRGLGCDSIYTLDLKIIPTYFIKDDPSTILMSNEDTVHWSNKVYAGTKFPDMPEPLPSNWKVVDKSLRDTVYFHTTYDVGTYVDACDSIRTTYFRLVDIFRDTTWAPVCANCTYEWKISDPNTGKDSTIYIPRLGERIPNAGETIWYYDSLKTSLGYDSIYNLQLTGFPNKSFSMEDMICQGEPYVWETHFDELGQPIVVPTRDSGWVTVLDKLLTDTVYIHPSTGAKIRVQCDSIWTLRLYVAPTYNETYNPDDVHFRDVLCSNDTLLWNEHLFVGYDYDTVAHPLLPATTRYDSVVYIPNTAGTLFYDSTFTNGTVMGCDSINYLTITIHPSPYKMLRDTIGDNDSVWSFGGKGGTLPRITRKDLVDPTPEEYADPDPSHHRDYKFFFIDTLQTVDGCDSIIHDSLWIFPTYRFVFDTAVCSNADCYKWRKYDCLNRVPHATRTYYDSILTMPAAGKRQMDSVYVLNLVVLPAALVEYSTNMCKNDTLYWEYQKVYHSFPVPTSTVQVNYALDTMTTSVQSRCDSIIRLNITWYDFYHYGVESPYPDNDSICQYDDYVWITQGDPTQTPHTKALYGEKGERFAKVPTDTLGWVTIYDSLYTTSPCHCDSTFTLRYYVKPSYYFYDTLVACTGDTVEWQEKKYMSEEAVVIHDTTLFATTGKCDSIYYLTMVFNQSYDQLLVDTICATDSLYEWQGHTFLDLVREVQATLVPKDTSLVDSLMTVVTGCDSILRLKLNVRPIYTYEWYDTICVSEKYQFNDHVLTETGVYVDTLINQFGCDSIQIVHLEVIPITQFQITPIVICADGGSYTLQYDYSGDYAPHHLYIVYDTLGYRNPMPRDTLVLESNAEQEIQIDLPSPPVGERYLRPNVYKASVFFDNSTCRDINLLRKDYLLTINYPSWVAEQHWSDAICVLNETYNGGYNFCAYQWYKNGEEMIGETKSYLFVPQYLDLNAEYQVLLTRSDDSVAVMTCPVDLTPRDSSLMPTKPYVSVVPSLVPMESPYTNIMCNEKGSYTIYDPYGTIIQEGRFVPGEHNAYPVKLPYVSGIYLFNLRQDNNGEQRTVKVMVQ